MTEYETVCVLQPDVSAEKRKNFDEKIKRIFASHSVTEMAVKEWGNRKLAFMIKKYKTGLYLQYIFSAPPKLIDEFEKNLCYEECVLRFLTTKFTKHSSKNVLVEPDGFSVSEMM